MKIFTAGCRGFVGSALPIVTDGCDLGIFDPPAWQLPARDLFTVTADDLVGYDAVIFVAGLSNDPMAEFDPAANYKQNAAAPAYLAWQARRAGVPRFVLASTCSIYAGRPGRLSVETDTPVCTDPYALSKLQGEAGTLQLAGQGFTPVVLRFGTCGGHSPRMRFDLLINTMVRAALTTGCVHVIHPAATRPLLDVRDAADALLHAATTPVPKGIYNALHSNRRVMEIAEAVSTITGCDIVTRSGVDHRSTMASNIRATCAGFTFTRSPEDTISHILDNWSHVPRPELANIRYSNIESYKQWKRNV